MAALIKALAEYLLVWAGQIINKGDELVMSVAMPPLLHLYLLQMFHLTLIATLGKVLPKRVGGGAL